ncbi:Asp23/Gls24 family envelope stress response protein [Williamsia muralis]|uniref:Asp23/Gls24 family envelope stress response protein n=1 Tax=Williamsia marianensis TaxID=85044 RepID=UPI003F5CE96F
MSDTTTTAARDANAQAGSSGGKSVVPSSGDRGRTAISQTVVAKIAGIAAREISGVSDLGGSAERVVGRVRDVLPGTSTASTQGIEVEVGERQAAVDVGIVADYGVDPAEAAGFIGRRRPSWTAHARPGEGGGHRRSRAKADTHHGDCAATLQLRRDRRGRGGQR